MMTTLRLLLLALSLAGPAGAAPMLGPEFEKFSTGRTLYFSLDGQPFGAEQFLGNRRTLWRFEDGPCADGIWRTEGDLICFSYDGESGAQCWRFDPEPSGPRATLIENGQPTGFTLDFSHADDKPLNCPGPAIGS